FGIVQRTAGSIVGIDVTPRYLLGEWLAIDGHYGVERVGATRYTTTDAAASPTFGSAARGARTTQRLGFGARFSTVDAFFRGRARYPVEVSFTHLDTVRGDAGAARLSRDQIQLRLYYRLRNR
ncbi:MAG: hypothetical protein H0W68_12975, partial [Gemmatimonadaceae bacterium]|nr:hypothetical protein [Gemmatimonadaceae bacterium]